MVQTSSLASSLPTAPFAVPPFIVHARDIVGSTSDEAKALAQAGAPDASVVWARPGFRESPPPLPAFDRVS